MRRAALQILSLSLVAAAGCGGSPNAGSSGPSASEVATSAVSGAMNVSGTSAEGAIGWTFPVSRKPLLRRVVDELSPISKAYAFDWSCTGGSLSPSFSGTGSYTYTPVSCSVTWDGGKSVSSIWSSTFALSYGGSCDSKHARIANQTEACQLTRTTASGGNTRTITGPDGNSYSITHDTNGADTGWDDAAVTPAPSNGGVVVTCNAGGCAAAGGTLVINGSHLTGTVKPAGGTVSTIWDHTVSTAEGGITVGSSAAGRSVNGAVTVQHNLAKYIATAKFNNVVFGEPGCCFPTGGSVTTTFQNSASQSTETLTFSSICGEATLTTASGSTVSITLLHCI